MGNIYSEIAAKYPLLKEEDELKYLSQFKSGSEEDKAHASDILLKSNIRLVLDCAKKYTSFGLELEDLVQEGCLGFQKALEKFDMSRGFRLSTYATFWIKQAIGRYARSHSRTISVPEHISGDMQQIVKFERVYLQENGHQPSLAETSDSTGLSVREIKRAKKAFSPTVSLQKTIGSDDSSTFADIVRDTSVEDQGARLDSVNILSCIEGISEAFTPREKEILKLRYGLVAGQIT